MLESGEHPELDSTSPRSGLRFLLDERGYPVGNAAEAIFDGLLIRTENPFHRGCDLAVNADPVADDRLWPRIAESVQPDLDVLGLTGCVADDFFCHCLVGRYQQSKLGHVLEDVLAGEIAHECPRRVGNF